MIKNIYNHGYTGKKPLLVNGSFYALSISVMENDPERIPPDEVTGASAAIVLKPGQTAYVRTNAVVEVEDNDMIVLFSIFPADIFLHTAILFPEHLTPGEPLVLTYTNMRQEEVRLYDGDICCYLNCHPRASAPEKVDAFALPTVEFEAKTTTTEKLIYTAAGAAFGIAAELALKLTAG